MFDGDSYNDFELPDLRQYTLSEADRQFDSVLTPIEFNNQWKLTAEEAEDLVKVKLFEVENDLI